MVLLVLGATWLVLLGAAWPPLIPLLEAWFSYGPHGPLRGRVARPRLTPGPPKGRVATPYTRGRSLVLLEATWSFMQCLMLVVTGVGSLGGN